MISVSAKLRLLEGFVIGHRSHVIAWTQAVDAGTVGGRGALGHSVARDATDKMFYSVQFVRI